jgi:hypothetical protein
MTQKDLGLKAGFSAATADSRIRKYEKDIMAPKDDIRQKLIEALDVDPSALSDINIESYEDIMQILFLLEDELGLEIERNDETTSLILKNDNPGHAILLSYLYAWYVQKKNLPDEDNETSFSAHTQYEKWQARFPRDLKEFWNEQRTAVDNFYNPLVHDAANEPKVSRLSEFLVDIRALIQSGISINADTKYYGVGDIGLILSFTVSEILNEDNKACHKAFTKFLCDIKTMNEYGMPYYVDMYSNESGTKISYTLRWSALPAFKNTIYKMQEHEMQKETLPDFEIDLFEKTLSSDLKMYDLDLKEEIEISCNKN